MVADGESLWTSVPELSQYQVQSLAKVRAGADSNAYQRQFDPAAGYEHLLAGVTSVRSLGRDTVMLGRGAVTCERYALTSVNAEAEAQGVKVLPHVLWVDPATHLVLLDSTRAEQHHPQLGEVYSVTMSRMVVAEADPVLTPDTFRFRPESGLRRVRRFMQASPEHTAMEGQPAEDFTLETLADSKPIKLSELKGKVVVLDFWATWCGPCRGWLPIVAKAHRDYAAKGLVVYAVNERETEPKVREYLEKQKLDVPVLMDLSGSVGSNYHSTAIPLTVIVGRDGKVFRVMVGLHDEEDLRDALHEAGID
jgi:thiol-disulfide isomerase/thioredoxin